MKSFYKYVQQKSLFTSYSVQTELFSYSVAGRDACPIAFQEFWNITEYTRRKIEKSIRQGENLDVPHGNVFVDKPDPKSSLCFDWFSHFCHYCEKQPDSDEIHTIERWKKIELWEEMQFDLLQSRKVKFKKDLPSYPVFTQVWRQHFKNLKIPKACRLGKCDTCSLIKEQMKTAKGQARLNLMAKRMRHKLMVTKERAEMRRLQDRARLNPEEWTSLTTDWYVNFYYFIYFLGVPLICYLIIIALLKAG